MTRLLKDYRPSNCLRLTFVLILTVFVAVGCSGSGDADPTTSDNNTPAGRSLSTGDATGTYVYDSGTGTLTVDLSSSSFQSDCGPQIEVSELTVLELTTTIIRLKTDPDSDEMTWARASGSADSVIGTWNYSEGSITDATITFNADGTFSISGTFECDDSGTTTTYYRDFDGDGYGDQSESIENDTQPPSYVSNSADCDDTHGDIHPNATEICGDSVDNNCDGSIDEGCFSEPRFTDMRDGTVRDNDTGLIWLKDANAFGYINWSDAMNEAANLSSGELGLSDGSVDGDWRLPTKAEWEAFMSAVYDHPALVNTKGDAQWSEGDAFTKVQSSYYWSSTELNSYYVWLSFMNIGLVNYTSKDNFFYVWPVRSGN